jgi:erythromycin esterase
MIRLQTLLLCGILVACDGATPVAPPAPPRLDPNALLSDSALHMPLGQGAPFVDGTWAGWIRANHQPVRSLVSTDFSDLQFLKPLIGGRRLLQLGESSHGAREFSMAKVRLVKFLHQEMGFDVISFESGMFDCYNADRRRNSDDAETIMRRCIFRVWHTLEVKELFDYLASPAGQSLTLAGFDIQLSGGITDEVSRPQLLRDALLPVDPGLAARMRATDSLTLHLIRTTGMATYLAAHGERLSPLYDSVATLIDANRVRIAAASGRPELPLVAARAARNHIEFIRSQITASLLIRDAGMAGNMTFLLDTLYPGRKIVAWAHNAHIRHDSPAIPGNEQLVMGYEVAGRHRNDMYTIGFYMGAGVSANNLRAPLYVVPPAANSLEAIMLRAERRFAFVDLLHQTQQPGTAWMFQQTAALSWGVGRYMQIPRDQYDAIFFIHTTSMPIYVP